MKGVLFFLFVSLSIMPAFAGEKDAAFERVTRTGTLRCGYTQVDPYLVKDANTGKMEGFAKDIMDEIGRRLSLKIEWTEDVGLDVILQGQHTGRYDMVCLPFFMASPRSRITFFSIPVFYQPAFVAVREKDVRFDKDYMAINDPSVAISVLEGEVSAVIARQRFPRAKMHDISQSQGYGFVLKDVAIGKADVTFSDVLSVRDFNKTNAEKLRIVARPLYVSAVGFPLPFDEKFKAMIDVSLQEMLLEGWLGRLFEAQYPEFYEQIFLPETPYEVQH